MPTESARDWGVRWRLFVSEAVGTAALVLGGLSIVIVMSGAGSPMPGIVPNERLRTALTAFLFGCVGAGIALSRVGRESGAHINPAVTMGFWLWRKLDARVAVGYVVAQMLGAGVGALPLLAWGAMGRSVVFGATIPGVGYSTAAVVMGEAVTTFGLVTTLSICLVFRRLRPYTPFAIAVLYAVMVPLESHISGTSTNPARTFGPALISGRWDGWWIYWVGPMVGMLAAVLVCSRLAKRIEVAKLYHFESDRRRLFHRMAGTR
ncbi:MIP/aquaporin family protein [Luteitalea pratensis]|uniref:MIP/aquaporin family protein n=1 Tax=Luteitalea pratensis TaxID=1855912 RepID=UPI0012FF738E|nr:aquaporin [Luteitalea pratensis]